MKMKLSWGYCALLLCLGCGCKETVVLVDPGAPTIAADWQVMSIEGVDFSLATPDDWVFELLSTERLAQKIEALNEDVWKSFGESEASIDLDRSIGVMGEPPGFGGLFGGPAQLILVIREETDGDLGIDGSAEMWKSTMASGTDHEPITEERVELPVGPAIKLQYREAVSLESNRVTVYCLVDGPVRYSLLFYETGSGGNALLPVAEIMETFRVRR